MDSPNWPAPFSLVAGFIFFGGPLVAIAWIQSVVLASACVVSAALGAWLGLRVRRSRLGAVQTLPAPVPVAEEPADPFATWAGESSVPSWVVDGQGHVLRMNELARTTLGFGPEPSGVSFDTWSQPSEIKAHWREATQRAIRGEVVKERLPFVFGGTVHHAEQVILPVGSARGNSRALAVMFESMPEKKSAAQRVSQEDVLARYCRAAPIPVIEWDTAGEVRTWNPAAELLFGYSADEAVRKKAGELIIPGDQWSRYANARSAIVDQGRSVNVVLQCRMKSGQIVSCEWTSFPILNSEHQVTTVVSFVKKIVESAPETSAPEEPAHPPTQARNLEALGRLASGVAHEFNNLLSPMVIEVEQLASHAGEPERVLTHVNSLRLAIQHARELTERTQLLGGELPEAREWTDLNELAKSVLKGVRGKLDSRITVNTTVAPSLPQLPVSRSGLAQILTQLILLARDSLAGSLSGSRPPIGRPTITVATSRYEGVNPSAPERGTGFYQVLSVRDNGPGLSVEAKAHAFEPFFAPYSPGSGHGLGLHLVWRLAHLHEGWVSLQSEPGQGSEVSVFIPELPIDRIPLPTGAVDVPDASPSPRKSGVLLVEDNLLVANALSGVLGDRGFDVYFAESGERAWAVLDEQKDKIDVILSDLNLPGMSGRELLRKLREHGLAIPMVILSGHIGGVDASELLALGAAGLITKPVNPRELIETVTRISGRVN